MTREDIIAMARQVESEGFAPVGIWPEVRRLCELVYDAGAAAEREKVAAWMIQRGYATGHGDTTEDLLKELDWRIDGRIAAEREACAKVCEELLGWYEDDPGSSAANAIRARSNT